MMAERKTDNPMGFYRICSYTMLPFHVRRNSDDSWQQSMLCLYGQKDPEFACGSCSLITYNLTNSSLSSKSDPLFYYKYYNINCRSVLSPTMLIDEVKKKLYYLHNPGFDPDYVVREASVQIERNADGSRAFKKASSAPRRFLGKYDFPANFHTNTVKYFLSPVDGSIFQLRSYFKDMFFPTGTTSHTISWLKLDDSVRVDAPSRIPYDGMVKTISYYKVEFAQNNLLDPFGSVLFSKDGGKMLLRFRLPHPNSMAHSLKSQVERDEFTDICGTTPDDPYVSQMKKLAVYVIFGLDNKSNRIELLTKFDPNSYQNHCDLLISTRLLPLCANYLGFPNSVAISFLSQRAVIKGEFLKYAFFSAIHKKKIVVLAVKSLLKTLQNGNIASTPKKLWFPMDDDRFKESFNKLSKDFKWDMLANAENELLVTSGEFVLQVHSEGIATIRFKLSPKEYKDYRTCAGCGVTEQYKRRSKNGKRISQFKICGWCKDNSLHKMWWDLPCHYCSEEYADDHWSVHKLQHEGKSKKKKAKK